MLKESDSSDARQLVGNNECWHLCPRCHQEWMHEEHRTLILDEYFKLCPACQTDIGYQGPKAAKRRYRSGRVYKRKESP